MFVKPAPDPNREGEVLVVVRPNTMRPLPREGAEVPDDFHWIRLLAQGDVVEAERPKEEPPPAPKAEATHAEKHVPELEHEHEPKEPV